MDRLKTNNYFFLVHSSRKIQRTNLLNVNTYNMLIERSLKHKPIQLYLNGTLNERNYYLYFTPRELYIQSQGKGN